MTIKAFTVAAVIALVPCGVPAEERVTPVGEDNTGLEVKAAPVAFEALNDRGEIWKSTDHLGKVIVLYCYPGDFTGGCVRQAQAFREGLARLEELGVIVVGVSGDSVNTHKLFKESHELTHTLLADPDGLVAEKLEIPVRQPAKLATVLTRGLDGKPLLDEQGNPVHIERRTTFPRWTFVIDRNGKLISKRTKVNPATDAEEVIKIIEALAR